MKILITGSSGFICGYLIEKLLENNYQIIGIDNYSKYGEIKKSYDLNPNYKFIHGDVKNVNLLKYLISDIILHKENGNNDTIKDVHYIDASNRSTLFFDAGEISNGTYNNVSFTMGLDTTKNISNLYVNESFHSSMFWPDMMGGGYHYMKIEGAYNNDSTFYNTHTGGTMGTDYSFKNKFEISLNTTDEDKIAEINFNMEINNWYQNPNSINLEPAIMSDITKQGQLQNNGMTDVFSIETYAGRR